MHGCVWMGGWGVVVGLALLAVIRYISNYVGCEGRTRACAQQAPTLRPTTRTHTHAAHPRRARSHPAPPLVSHDLPPSLLAVQSHPLGHIVPAMHGGVEGGGAGARVNTRALAPVQGHALACVPPPTPGHRPTPLRTRNTHLFRHMCGTSRGYTSSRHSLAQVMKVRVAVEAANRTWVQAGRGGWCVWCGGRGWVGAQRATAFRAAERARQARGAERDRPPPQPPPPPRAPGSSYPTAPAPALLQSQAPAPSAGGPPAACRSSP